MAASEYADILASLRAHSLGNLVASIAGYKVGILRRRGQANTCWLQACSGARQPLAAGPRAGPHTPPSLAPPVQVGSSAWLQTRTACLSKLKHSQFPDVNPAALREDLVRCTGGGGGGGN